MVDMLLKRVRVGGVRNGRYKSNRFRLQPPSLVTETRRLTGTFDAPPPPRAPRVARFRPPA